MRGTAKITCPSRELPKKVLLANRDETEVEWYVPWRTCRNVNEGHGFTCSECGDWTSNPFPEIMPSLKLNYCPNCGARVIEERE